MEVHTLAAAVVDRIADQQARMRGPMLWQVTDVLLRYERTLNEARAVLVEVDMRLLALGIHRSDDTRKHIARALEHMGN